MPVSCYMMNKSIKEMIHIMTERVKNVNHQLTRLCVELKGNLLWPLQRSALSQQNQSVYEECIRSSGRGPALDHDYRAKAYNEDSHAPRAMRNLTKS